MGSRAGFIVVLLLCGFVFFFKENIVLFLVNDRLHKISPGTELSLKKFSLGAGHVFLENFSLNLKQKAFPCLSLRGHDAFFSFSPFRIFRKGVLGLKAARVHLDVLTWDAIKLENGTLDFLRNRKETFLVSPLHIERLSYKKSEIKGITGRFRLSRDTLFIDDVLFAFFGGQIKCSGSFVFLGFARPLELTLHLEHIDINEVIKFFEFDKRVQANGFYTGDIRFVLEGVNIRLLDGVLSAQKGGQLVVIDSSLVERNLLPDKGLNIVVENLKNYHYDIGNIRLSKEGENIKFDVLLEGVEGSRHFEVVWHKLG